MDELARLPSEQRRAYFEQAAAKLGLVAPVVEKDFWVCWSLKRLFSLAEFQDHLTFKGGTSLSKVYRVIERFSEDVDVAIERGFLGFGGDMEPERGVSGKEQQRRVDDLKAACQATIADRLAPQLQQAIAAGIAGSASWSLTTDPADRDQQTLLFQFPRATAGELSPHFSMSVKIELGARSDHFPVQSAEVTPYLCDAFPDALSHRSMRPAPACPAGTSPWTSPKANSWSAVAMARRCTPACSGSPLGTAQLLKTPSFSRRKIESIESARREAFSSSDWYRRNPSKRASQISCDERPPSSIWWLKIRPFPS